MMDKEPEEMQFLGIVGILRESLKILVHYPRLLFPLASTLVLPLSYALLAYPLLSDPLIQQIKNNELELSHRNRMGNLDMTHTRNVLYEEWMKLGVMAFSYIVFVFAFSLLSTAAVVYSVACIYSGKELSFVKVMNVVPRVWKRLMLTFLWIFLIMVTYNLVLLLSAVIVIDVAAATGVPLLICLIVLVVIFFGIQVYLNAIWHLASVISVLEENYGLRALKKSLTLVKGNKGIACVLVFLYMICTWIISAIFHSQVIIPDYYPGHPSNIISRVFVGSLLTLALTLVYLWGTLVQSVFYLTCKSYHHESIDRISLSELLDAYSGEYVPLKGAQPMETFDV